MSAVQAQSGQSIKHPRSVFIGGEWVKPATSNTLSIISPVTEEVIATYAEASPQDVDRAVAAAREAFDKGPWPRLSQVERGKAAQESRRDHEEPARGARRDLDRGSRRADLLHALRVGSGRGIVRVLRRAHSDVQAGRRAPARQRRSGARREGAGRRLRRHHAVERAARPALLQGRGRARRRLHHRGEAVTGDADGRVHPGGVHRSRGPAARRVQRGAGRPRGRRLPRASPRHRQDQLHGQQRRGQQDRRCGGRAPGTHELRARRQVGRDRDGGRGYRQRAAESRAVLHADHRPGVLLADARARAAEAQAGSARRLRGRRAPGQGRRSRRRKTRRWARSPWSAS